MKTTKLISMAFVAIASAALLSSCEKTETTVDYSEETVLSDDLTEALFDDAVDEADAYSDDSNFKSTEIDSCAPVITIEAEPNTRFPRTITVDFGEDYCTAKNGRLRKGKIIIIQSAPKFEAGASRTISFENYYVNDYHIEGTQTVTFGGKNNDGNYFWTYKLTGGTITSPDNIVYSRDAEHTRTLTNGAETLTRWDNEWSITGFASGINGDGESYTRTIDSENPIIRNAACNFAISGIVSIEHTNKPTVTLDYGDGTCDNIATITVDGETKEINLRKVFH